MSDTIPTTKLQRAIKFDHWAPRKARTRLAAIQLQIRGFDADYHPCPGPIGHPLPQCAASYRR